VESKLLNSDGNSADHKLKMPVLRFSDAGDVGSETKNPLIIFKHYLDHLSLFYVDGYSLGGAANR
jgi:hypothetical protein